MVDVEILSQAVYLFIATVRRLFIAIVRGSPLALNGIYALTYALT